MTTLLPLTPDELLTTTRAVRKRLDLDRPVPRSVVAECVAVAAQAPSASNVQPYRFMVVDAPPVRAAIADLYRSGYDRYNGPRTSPNDQERPEHPLQSSSDHLRDHMHNVPMLVIPCFMGNLAEPRSSALRAGQWGSILPAVWSFMLALRARGLGSVFTAVHLAHEGEVAEMLGIPYPDVSQVGLLPVAYTRGTDFRPGTRADPGQTTRWNHW
ncbi:nitroreductase family protein [Nocardioides terrisoli]|uniref:nitroreductase family protein n=1 Tax=Nocardioides terrisoli TaxID=3388267 RepID=UPI0037C94C6A